MFTLHQDIRGKVSIDFSDENSLRALTKCFLKRDFNLDVKLPETNLIPTVPLRLNYVLWIEDIIQTFEIKDPIGIDIGNLHI